MKNKMKIFNKIKPIHILSIYLFIAIIQIIFNKNPLLLLIFIGGLMGYYIILFIEANKKSLNCRLEKTKNGK